MSVTAEYRGGNHRGSEEGFAGVRLLDPVPAQTWVSAGDSARRGFDPSRLALVESEDSGRARESSGLLSSRRPGRTAPIFGLSKAWRFDLSAALHVRDAAAQGILPEVSRGARASGGDWRLNAGVRSDRGHACTFASESWTKRSAICWKRCARNHDWEPSTCGWRSCIAP